MMYPITKAGHIYMRNRLEEGSLLRGPFEIVIWKEKMTDDMYDT